MNQTERLPTLFIPHGGGPCFFMDWNPPHAWDRMAEWLRAVPRLVGQRPRAVLVISAHWEAPAFTVNAREHHELLFDYYGFPEHTYQLQWPARGDAALAERTKTLLTEAGLPVARDDSRGLDHGVFIPFMLIDPRAETPVVQLSLREGLDPAEHLAMGRALAPLRDEGVLIVGTGMSFHNMGRFRRDNAVLDADSVTFDDWLTQAVTQPAAARTQALAKWEQAPSARASHPEEEHLLPLQVVAGAAGEDAGRQALSDRVLGSAQSAYVFGG
ncbi:DODA-type extradiol aromatic ring-opening family dioxygenase [Pseudazoarcus pumilus]|uniref:Dioxygenase n=1 Tax=Pseudazoarcus pumilus TaxID=2067960 RepID=A0A2I6S7H7_9RHOO|nr:class III extradiol ring-cleavage dioxygenase [Pseudazoarcus pumilus]AUN95192.1 dioxygenase [Pseudazoarcus pumilus]